MGKKNEAIYGRSAGYNLANKIIIRAKQNKSDPKWEMEKEIEFRERSGIGLTISVGDESLKEVVQQIGRLGAETACMAHLYILRNEFGYGEKRLKQHENAFRSASWRMVSGSLYEWYGFMDKVAAVYKVQIKYKDKPKIRVNDFEKWILNGLKSAYEHYCVHGNVNALIETMPKERHKVTNLVSISKNSDAILRNVSDQIFENLSIMLNCEISKFGKVRNKRYMDRKDLMIECIDEGYVHYHDILDTMIEEAGLKEENYIAVRNEPYAWIKRREE